MRVYASPTRPRTDDAALVRRTQAGDEGAFATIFNRHHPPLLSYCRHMLGNQTEGEDALQQAFIKAHQALLAGTAPRELRPWLYAIARNCCLSAIAARRPTALLEERAPALGGLSEEVHQREDLRELVAGIGRLPEDQRSALLLAELDDLPHEAIATVVGCEVSKVKALIYQARSALIADRDAQNTPCEDIREQLAVAHGGELRRGPLRRHLKLCVGCRDFQLAVTSQRQSLGVLLPVLPGAGLAAAILGHGAVHAAGAASIGGAGAGGAGVGATGLGGASMGGAGVGATGLGGASAGGASVGATAASGTGIAASGAAAATTAVGAGAGAGGGTGIGALVGGGLVTKLAIGGAVVALAAAGAVTVHRREAHASTYHPTGLQLASSNTPGRRVSATDIADSSDGLPGSLAPGAPAALPLADGARPPGTDGSVDAGSPTGLFSLGGNANPLLSTAGTLAPSGPAPGSPGQPAVTLIQRKSGAGGDPAARAEHRAELARHKASLRRKAALLRRRASIRRRALLRRRASIRRRALLRREALLRRRLAERRRARREALERRRLARAKPPKTTPPAKPPVAPAPAVKAPRRKAHPPLPTTTPTPVTTGSTITGSTTPEAGKPHQPKQTTTDTETSPTTKAHPKKHPVEEEKEKEKEQPPNLEAKPEVTGVDVQPTPTETETGGTHHAS